MSEEPKSEFGGTGGQEVKAGRLWGVSLLNIACALVPTVSLYLYFFYQGAVRLEIEKIFLETFEGLAWLPTTLLSCMEQISGPLAVGSVIIAGVVVKTSKSQKAKAAALSTVGGFFLAAVCFLVGAVLMPTFF